MEPSSNFESFLSFLENQEIETTNPKMKEVVESYTFREISEKKEIEQNLKKLRRISKNRK